MFPSTPRAPHARKADTLRRLGHDVDAWVATAGSRPSRAHLVPLWFVWHDDRVVLATLASSVTVRNVLASQRLRMALGSPTDVVLIDGTTTVVRPPVAADAPMAAFVAKLGWDPSLETEPHAFIIVHPTRIQAWRGENELPGRQLMRAGVWL